MAKSLFEILLWSILIIIIIFVTFYIFKNSYQSYIGGVNKSINESGQRNIINIEINKSSYIHDDGQYNREVEGPINKYDVHLKMNIKNRGNDINVIPIIKLFDSYSLCHNIIIDGVQKSPASIEIKKNEKALIECDAIEYTNHQMNIICGRNSNGYALCQTKMSEGSEIKVGNYTIKLDKIYFAKLKRNYIGTFYIYDGDVVPKKIDIQKKDIFDENTLEISDIKTYVNGGWVNITFACPENVHRGSFPCIRLKTFGKPLHNIPFGNPVEVLIFPKGCPFWNSILSNPLNYDYSSPEKIKNAIDYCSDQIMGYSPIKIPFNKNFMSCSC